MVSSQTWSCITKEQCVWKTESIMTNMFTSLFLWLFLSSIMAIITTGLIMRKCKNFQQLQPRGNGIQRRRAETKVDLFGGIQQGEKGCKICKGGGGVDCSVCNGTGKDKVNGNVLERWTCKKCKGFGYVPCPSCSKGSKGLTPEQRGER